MATAVKACSRCGCEHNIDNNFPPSSTRDGLSSCNSEKVNAARRLRETKRKPAKPSPTALAEQLARLDQHVARLEERVGHD